MSTNVKYLNQQDAFPSKNIIQKKMSVNNKIIPVNNKTKSFRGKVEIEGSVIYHKTEYKERRDHYAYYSVNVPINGYDTDRETFFGLYNGFDEEEEPDGKARVNCSCFIY